MEIVTCIIIICIFLISITIVGILMFSEKSAKLIWTEVKFEIIYNIIGVKSVMGDIWKKRINDNIELTQATGKIAVVTGGARGIGVEVVRQLVKLDVNVVIGCRSVLAGESLMKRIRAEGIAAGNIEVLELNLNSIKSIRCFAAAVKEKHSKINVLINNAGKMFGPYMKTEDGHESQFMTNYLGHFLLTHLLLPELKLAGEISGNYSRIVNVSSCAHLAANGSFLDENYHKEYIPAASYAESKLAQILFSNYLNRLLEEKGIPISSYSVHPGVVNTDLFKGTFLERFSTKGTRKLLLKSPRQGAASTLYASLFSKLEAKGGIYINNCSIVPTSQIAYSIELQRRTFTYSKSLLDIGLFGGVLDDNN